MLSAAAKKVSLLIFITTALATIGCKKDNQDNSPLYFVAHQTPTSPDKPFAATPGFPLTIPDVYNTKYLKQWNAWKQTGGSRFDWILLGDSYTQGTYYAENLRLKVLSEGYQDGGPGYCSFNRWNGALYSKDSSIEPAEFDFSYNPLQWNYEKRNTVGPCGFVTSTAPDAMINITANEALSSITLIYERHANAGSFRYRVNGGGWTTVSDNNNIPDIGSTVIDVSGAGTKINVDVDPINPGMIFCGALAKKSGNVFTMHKCGSSGAPAYLFATNDLWSQSTKLLTPKGVLIEFGVNEINGNVPAEEMRASVQNIIDKIRAFSPNCDILIVSPPETTLEIEHPKRYKLKDYTTMLTKLASDNAAAFIDLNVVFGPFSQASVDKGLFDADRMHPGSKGGELIANTIFMALKSKQ